MKNGNLAHLPCRGLVGVVITAIFAAASLASLWGPEAPSALSSGRAPQLGDIADIPWAIKDGGMLIWHFTKATTVGDALAQAGIHLDIGDEVFPPPNAPLSPGLTVMVKRAKDVELVVEGQRRRLRTQMATVGALLWEEGISLGPWDEVEPRPDAVVKDGMVVRVVRVGLARVVEEETVPRPVAYRDDGSLPIGQSYVEAQGSDGVVRRYYDVVYRDGQVAQRVMVKQEEIPPQAMVVVRGAGPPISHGGGCEGISYKRALTVWATWYQPGVNGVGYTTATGLPVTMGVVAVDPAVISLGTRLCVPGYGMAVAADTGSGIRGYMIDLAYPPWVVPNWHTGYVTIYILD